MTDRDEREAAIEQLEAALAVEGGKAKDVHIREAIQFLRIGAATAPPSDST